VKLTIHRGAHEIGGSCLELTSDNSTILVDIGLPLDYNPNATPDRLAPQPLFNNLVNGNTKVNGVLLSHPHLDHYGLVGQLPDAMPIFCGKATADLMQITAQLSPERVAIPKMNFFEPSKSFQIGDFTITPYLMDHSAFDAYGFLLTSVSKNIFYTGDFRGHGRKATLLKHLPGKLPTIDALIMEGTLIGNRSDEQHQSEQELEDRFAKVMEQTEGITLITTSSQNIDRLVTIFRAAKKSGRMFIIDFYTAEILDLLKKYARLPNAKWPQIRVCYPQLLCRYFERLGHTHILDKHRKNGIRWSRINEKRNNMAMLVRPGFTPNLKRHINLEKAAWIYSMWPGYLRRSESLQKLQGFMKEKNVPYHYIHTSGHAKISDMQKFVDALKPKTLVPIHSFHTEMFSDYFQNVTSVNDGETITI
jgi:ribonuclease J